jgi:hypothetical protein
MRQGQQQRSRSVKVLLCFAPYLLNLCTLSPQVHAETLRQAGQDRQASSSHCSRVALSAQIPAPFAPDPQRTTEPLCCELRDGANRTIPVSSVQIDIPPLFLLTLLPLDADELVGKVQLLPIFQAPHSSRPPPLYLANAVLLI